MADHVNIRHPDYRREFWRYQEEIAKLKAIIGVRNEEIAAMRGDLDAIFNNARNGIHVELYYDDGEVIELLRADPEFIAGIRAGALRQAAAVVRSASDADNDQPVKLEDIAAELERHAKDQST